MKNGVDKSAMTGRSGMVLLVGVFTFMTISAKPQDIHFSQLSQTPLLVNPALAGAFNGNSRAFVNYKNQWQLLDKAYRTSAFSCDAKVFRKPQKNNYFGAGITAFTDRAGDFDLRTTSVKLSLSGIVEVGDKQIVSGGIQGGFAQEGLDLSNPRTSAQFVNTYDPALPSGESGEQLTGLYGDFSLGVAWSLWKEELNMASNDEFQSTVGFAYHHVNRPKLAFSAQEERLYSKLVLHGSLYLGIKSTPLALVPTAVVFRQGPATEVNIGSYLRYRIKEDSRYTGFVKETTLLFGLHSRVGDAIIPSFMLIVSDYAVAVSYDINTSKLRSASSGRGGIEFSLRFLSPKALVKGRGRGAKNDGMM